MTKALRSATKMAARATNIIILHNYLALCLSFPLICVHEFSVSMKNDRKVIDMLRAATEAEDLARAIFTIHHNVSYF